MEYPGFCGPTNQSQSYVADQELSINLYPERQQFGSSSKWTLYPTPGTDNVNTSRLKTLGGRGRAHAFVGGVEYAVIGNIFLSIEEDGDFHFWGGIVDDGLPATISSNGDGGKQLLICGGRNAYIFDLTTNTLSLVPALVGLARMGDFISGYFLVLDDLTSTFYVSALLDGTSWATGTDFAQRSLQGDPWKAMKVLNQQIYLIGTQTSEVWYPTDATFPFAPNPSGLIEHGTTAQWSVARCGTLLIWLAASDQGDRYFVALSGLSPTIISTQPLSSELSSYAEVDDAEADSYSDLGHTFYYVTFRTQNFTQCWDASTQMWHGRAFWNKEQCSWKMWGPMWHVMAYGQHRVLHSSLPYVMKFTYAFSLEYSDFVSPSTGERTATLYEIRRYRRPPAIIANNERIFVSEFEVLMEPATPTQFAAIQVTGFNPYVVDGQIMMRQSRDGGRSWLPERWQGIGVRGQYETRANWHRCGMGRKHVMEIAFTSSAMLRVVNAFLKTPQKVKAA